MICYLEHALFPYVRLVAPLYEQFPSLFATIMFLPICMILYNKDLVVFSYIIK